MQLLFTNNPPYWLPCICCRPDLLIVGPVTIDIVGGNTPCGGSVSYAAAAAAAFGLRAHVVTGTRSLALCSTSASELHINAFASILQYDRVYVWCACIPRTDLQPTTLMTAPMISVPHCCIHVMCLTLKYTLPLHASAVCAPCVCAVAGPDADLSVFQGHHLRVIPSDATLTFEHTYTWWGESRAQRSHVILSQHGTERACNNMPEHHASS